MRFIINEKPSLQGINTVTIKNNYYRRTEKSLKRATKNSDEWKKC